MVNKPNTKFSDKGQNKDSDVKKKMTKKKFKKVSEYGRQLEEKQKVKRLYGLRERQFRNNFKKATRMEGAPGENLLSLLECRLDNVVFRLKMSVTCSQARQMVVHGHVMVNGKKVTAPSFMASVGDTISLADKSLKKEKFVETVVDKRMNIAIKVPEWLELKKQSRSGQILRLPVRTDIPFAVEEHLIVELYSR